MPSFFSISKLPPTVLRPHRLFVCFFDHTCFTYHRRNEDSFSELLIGGSGEGGVLLLSCVQIGCDHESGSNLLSCWMWLGTCRTFENLQSDAKSFLKVVQIFHVSTIWRGTAGQEQSGRESRHVLIWIGLVIFALIKTGFFVCSSLSVCVRSKIGSQTIAVGWG